jgi:ribosome-binding ATPase
MKIGIVGFSGSGKTTLFNALTGQNAPTGYGGGKVNLGAIKVPDRRVDRLAEIDDPKKTTYAEISLADVPGGRGGSSLDPQTLSRLREMEAFVQVVRGFDAGEGAPDPAREVREFEAELILSDMQVAEKRAERLRKDRSDMRQLALIEKCLERLGEEKPLRSLGLSEDDAAILVGFAFLSLTPLMVVLSLPEGASSGDVPAPLAAVAAEKGLTVMALCGAMEAEIAALAPEDQRDFLAELGQTEPASARFARAAFAMLDLITFLTHGPDECRAWPVRRGSNAVEAARAIHSDLARGFIRAEVIAFDDFDKLGTEAACRDAGKFRIEGRDYVVKDGDICHIRFNV